MERHNLVPCSHSDVADNRKKSVYATEAPK